MLNKQISIYKKKNLTNIVTMYANWMNPIYSLDAWVRSKQETANIILDSK